MQISFLSATRIAVLGEDEDIQSSVSPLFSRPLFAGGLVTPSAGVSEGVLVGVPDPLALPNNCFYPASGWKRTLAKRLFVSTNGLHSTQAVSASGHPLHLAAGWTALRSEPAVIRIVQEGRREASDVTNQFAALNRYAAVVYKEFNGISALAEKVNAYVAGRFQRSDEEGDAKWFREYHQLRNRMSLFGLNLNEQWVRFTEEWLIRDAKLAVQLLAVAVERHTNLRQAALKCKISLIGAAKVILRRALGRIYQIGNLISAQRSWYLHHGSHPNGSLTLTATGCFLRVCFQPA